VIRFPPEHVEDRAVAEPPEPHFTSKPETEDVVSEGLVEAALRNVFLRLLFQRVDRLIVVLPVAVRPAGLLSFNLPPCEAAHLA
jgi:hypothetical protein